METQIKKWGNSLGIRIPALLAKQVNINDGSVVEINIQGSKLEINPVNKPKYSLSDFMDQVTDDKLHKEISSGEAAGNELW